MPVHVANSGEIYRPDERLPADDRWMWTLARAMDEAVRIGPWSIGLDPLLGLIPGLGDFIGAFIAMVIVARAVQAGLPRVAIARMVTNIAIDTFVGSIPIFGDAFDFAYKSNIKNVRIYEQSLYASSRGSACHWGFFLALFLGLGAAMSLLIWGFIALIRAI
jgi:hypothetical protein